MGTAFFLIGILFWGCLTGGLPSAPEEFRIVWENGLPVAVNPGRPVPRPDGPRKLVLEEAWTISGPEGPGGAAFSERIEFAADDLGRVYVLDCREKRIYRFDREGRLLGTIGRPGNGPGEFAFPSDIAFFAGTLTVYEADGQRFHSFSAAGDLLKSGPFPRLLLPPYIPIADGGLIASVREERQGALFLATAAFDADGRRLFDLRSARTPSQPVPPRPGDQEGRVRYLAELFSRTAYRPRFITAADPDGGIWYSWTGAYEIHRLNGKGRKLGILRVEGRPIDLEREERRFYLEEVLPEELSTWHRMDEAFREAVRKSISFPEVKPALVQLIPMDRGGLMVVRDGWYGGPALLHVFDPEGRFIAEKRMDIPVNKGLCRGGCFFASGKNREGESRLMCFRYRLER